MQIHADYFRPIVPLASSKKPNTMLLNPDWILGFFTGLAVGKGFGNKRVLFYYYKADAFWKQIALLREAAFGLDLTGHRKDS